MTELDPGSAPRRSVLAVDLVGRDEEIAALRSGVDDATRGRGRVMFVLGEAGIGKSRLAHAAAAEAERRGLRLLRGRAVPTATPVAYRPLAEALSSAVRAGAGPDGAELEPFRATLGRLIPEWRAGPRRDVDDSVLVLAEGVLRFLRSVATRDGCTIVLEDLHWADPETLAIVEYLADNLAMEPILCLVTIRTETSSPSQDLARTLHARRASGLIELDRLGERDVALMLDSCLGPASQSPELTAMAARADGVPFLVEELLSAAVASNALVHDGTAWVLSGNTDHVVPLTFGDTVQRRLAVLGADGRAVLGAAAILGRGFDWRLLPLITMLDESVVEAALHAAVDSQLVVVHHGAFRFRHALSRDAVLAEMLPSERARVCRRALAAIEQSHPGLPGPWCDLAAEVAEGAGERDRAGALLLQGGRRALEAGALGTAEVKLERARVLIAPESPQALDVEEELTSVLAAAGKPDRTVKVGEALLAKLGDDPDRAARRAETHLRLARAAVAAARWTSADEHLEQATTEAARVTDDGLRARIDIVSAQIAILRSPDEASLLARAALETADRDDLPEVACEALEVIGRVERSHDLVAAEAAFSRAHDLAVSHQRDVWRMRALHELGTVELLRAGSVRRLEEARELSVSLGAPATTAVIEVQIGATLSVRDDPEPGADACRRAEVLARRYRLDHTLAAALAFQAVSHARALRQDAVDQCVAEALERGRGMPEVGYNTGFARAHLGLAREDRAAAVDDLTSGTVAATHAVGVETTGPSAGILALLLAVEGDGGAAGEWLRPPPVHFIGRGHARYAEAVIAGRNGDGTSAVELVARGGDELGDCNWYRQLGRRLVAEAAITDGWGDPASWLVEALAFFDQSGDTRIASACRSLLRKAGATVPRRRREPPAELAALVALGITAREAEVLELLGHGLSNRDIAARLHLSPRTVERHVASLSVKTGAARRSEVVAFGARITGDTVAP